MMRNFLNLCKMEYKINQNRLDSVIFNYLDGRWYPDYSWDTHEDYKRAMDVWEEAIFEVNDFLTYELFKQDDNNVLILYPNIIQDMNGVFNDMWKESFKKWFEFHTGLNVDIIQFYNSDDPIINI